MQQALIDQHAQNAGTIDLSEKVFDTQVSETAIYESIKNLLANKRQGTASTKTRATVSGSTKKPWRQKGTGRARVGSRKSPLWKGKGIIFGPHPRDYSYVIPKKLKRKALFSVLTKAKREGVLKVLDDFELEAIKTKPMVDIFAKLSPKKRVLFITCPNDSSGGEENYQKIKKSGANIPWLKIVNVNSVEIKDLYYARDVIFSKSAIKIINERYEAREISHAS